MSYWNSTKSRLTYRQSYILPVTTILCRFNGTEVGFVFHPGAPATTHLFPENDSNQYKVEQKIVFTPRPGMFNGKIQSGKRRNALRRPEAFLEAVRSKEDRANGRFRFITVSYSYVYTWVHIYRAKSRKRYVHELYTTQLDIAVISLQRVNWRGNI